MIPTWGGLSPPIPWCLTRPTLKTLIATVMCATIRYEISIRRGNLTVAAQADFHLPAWLVGLAQGIGLLELPVSGGQFGVALSIPFFDSAEFDSGFFFGVQIPSFDLGTGKGSINISLFPESSVKDLAGNSDITASSTLFGLNAGVTFDPITEEIRGFQFGLGSGINLLGLTVDVTNVLSARHGLIFDNGLPSSTRQEFGSSCLPCQRFGAQ